jgi:hypothetical protein
MPPSWLGDTDTVRLSARWRSLRGGVWGRVAVSWGCEGADCHEAGCSKGADTPVLLQAAAVSRTEPAQFCCFLQAVHYAASLLLRHIKHLRVGVLESVDARRTEK